MITKGLFTPNISGTFNDWQDFIELYLNHSRRASTVTLSLYWRLKTGSKPIPKHELYRQLWRSKQGLNLVAWFREAIHRIWVESTAVWKGPLSTPYSRQVQCYLRALSELDRSIDLLDPFCIGTLWVLSLNKTKTQRQRDFGNLRQGTLSKTKNLVFENDSSCNLPTEDENRSCN